MINATALFVFLILTKHFIADGPLQVEYLYNNKGKFMHPGGLIHAGCHGVLTLFAIALWGTILSVPLSVETIVTLSFIDFVLHYLIDYTKVHVTKHMNLSKLTKDAEGKYALCIYSNTYFILMLADQYLHGLTYVLIMVLLI